MMRRLLLSVFLALPVVVSGNAHAADPPAIGTNPGIKIDLKTQLEKGLRARRPVEFQYIEQVVDGVAAGTIPRSLVDSTFIWARKQRSRQLQYFQFALKTRGDKMGVVTPSLDGQFINPITGTLPSTPPSGPPLTD